jgi:N-acetylgalactosamine PTS system EIIA component
MNGLIVSGHGTFASGLQSAVKLIAGDQPNVEFVDFLESDSVADLKTRLKAAMNKLKDCEGILFLCDLAGGSPFKTAVLISAEHPNSVVIGGTNLVMVVDAAVSKDSFSIKELKDAAIQSGMVGIKSFQKTERPKKEGGGI